MKDLTLAIQEYQRQAVDLAEIQEEVFEAKADMTMKALGVLLNQINEGISGLFEGMASAEHFDKTLGEKMQKTIQDAITAFTQVKHEINFAPNISVDINPLKLVVSEALKESSRIYNLIEKLVNSGGKYDELYRLALLLVEKQNNFYEKISKIDLTKPLEAINETLNKPNNWSATIEVTKRDQQKGWFQEATITNKQIK